MAGERHAMCESAFKERYFRFDGQMLCYICMVFLLVGPDCRVIRKDPPLVLQMTEELLYLLLCTVRDFHFVHAR